MKKKLSAIVLCGAMLLSLVACGKVEGGNEEKAAPVKKYMKVTSYSPSDESYSTVTEEKYDEKGRTTYRKVTNKSNGQETVTEYTYDWVEAGNKAVAEMETGWTITITYDNEGNKVEEVEERPDYRIIQNYAYKDSKLTNMKSETYNAGELLFAQESYYDEYGNITKGIYKSTGDDTEQVMEYSNEYDKNGKLLSVSITNPETGETTTAMECVYDENGNMVKVEMQNQYQEYTYDRDGNVIEAKGYYEEKLISHTIYEYYDN